MSMKMRPILTCMLPLACKKAPDVPGLICWNMLVIVLQIAWFLPAPRPFLP